MVAAALSYYFVWGRSGTALALAFKPGQTVRHHMAMSLEGSMSIGAQTTPLSVDTSVDVEWRVVSVDATGTATVRMTILKGTIYANGQSEPAPSDFDQTFLLTPDGRVLSTTGSTLFNGPGESVFNQASQVSAILPDGRVNPGDTWSKTVSATLFGDALTYTANGTYLRNERIDGVDAAVVETRTAMPLDLTFDLGKLAGLFASPGADVPNANVTYGGNISSDTTTWIDTSARSIVKTVGNGRFSLRISVDGELPPNTPRSLQMSGTLSVTIEPI